MFNKLMAVPSPEIWLIPAGYGLCGQASESSAPAEESTLNLSGARLEIDGIAKELAYFLEFLIPERLTDLGGNCSR